MSDPVAGPPSGVLVNLRAWLAESPWRLAAGWATLAGLGATAGLRIVDLSLITLVLALLLADAVWGALWAQIAERSKWPEQDDGGIGRLPYASPEGIAGHPGWLSHALRDMLPVAALAIVLALVVGQSAVVLTAVVIGLAMAGWVMYRSQHAGVARWLQALALIMTPFVLGMWLAPRTPDWPEVGWLLALGLGFAVLFRAGLAAGAAEAPAALLAAAGSVFVLAALLWAGRPIAAGLAAAAAAAPLLILSQYGRNETVSLRAVHAWCWLLALGATVALGIGIG
jgi:hypothetical protein